jgi:hypothetical protein
VVKWLQPIEIHWCVVMWLQPIEIHWCVVMWLTTHTDISQVAILTTVTLASTSNALPDDGVTAPKHVGVVLM